MYALLKPKGVTVSAMLAKAVAEVLKNHPIINAAYVEGGIKYNKGKIVVEKKKNILIFFILCCRIY